MCLPDWFDEEDEKQTTQPATAVKAISSCPSGYEERRIIVAQGLQFRNKDMAISDRIPDALIAGGLKVTSLGSNEYKYVSDAQKVCYYLRIITTRNDFKKALESPEVHLIYDGHARYGRGPCFGDYDFVYGKPLPKGEQWQNGAGPADNFGIFRMGMPYIGVPAEEVHTHGYTPNLVSGSTKVSIGDCDAELVPYHGELKAYKASDLHASLHLHTASKNPDALYLGYTRNYDNKKAVPFVVHNAGWEKTVSAPMDLGATQMNCRVFCHFGCSTLIHNQAVVRKKKPWPKKGDYQLAYWTSDPSYSFTTKWWLYHLFSYPEYNAFKPWEPQIKNYVLPMTNKSIAAEVKAYNTSHAKDPINMYKIV